MLSSIIERRAHISCIFLLLLFVSYKPLSSYLVLTPMADSFGIHADNAPGIEIQEVRLSLFSKGSYTKLKNTLIRAILAAEITITDRRYVGHEDDTGYHNYAIDVAKHYEMEE